MKKLTLYTLIILVLTCGCTKSNLNSAKTFSQEEIQQTTNQETSLNDEEPQPQENSKEKTLKICIRLTGRKGNVYQRI